MDLKQLPNADKGMLKTGTERREKHMNIIDAIHRLDDVVERLENLKGRIHPVPVDPEAAVNRSVMSLNEFLNESSSIIHIKVDQANDLIREIEDLLF